MKTPLLARQLLTVIILLGSSISLFGQQSTGQQTPAARPPAAPITIEQIKGSIYQVKGGSGANTGFCIGEKEIVVIDAKMSDESAGEMLKAIANVSPLPVRKVVLTHSDGDHVNGLTGFPASIDIISHENTRIHVATAFRGEKQRAFLPNVTFTDALYLSRGVDSTVGRIELLYFGPAHTDGDIVVYFPAEKIAFVGDLMFLNRDPLIHRAKNGNSFGLVKVLKAILNLDVDMILSGHNEKATKDDIRKFVAGIEEKQEKIAAMVKAGKSIDDVRTAFNVSTAPARPGGTRWLSLVEVIYMDLTAKK
jgi:glyoxylase-like metal-dependent hydrolase (beta-lactamase superfamily II)